MHTFQYRYGKSRRFRDWFRLPENESDPPHYWAMWESSVVIREIVGPFGVSEYEITISNACGVYVFYLLNEVLSRGAVGYISRQLVDAVNSAM